MNPQSASSDAAPIAPVVDAVLDASQVAALISDLKAYAHVEQIVVRTGVRGPKNAHAVTSLDDAVEQLQTHHAKGVQIRYCHDGGQWIDTLLPGEGGIRLVRIRHELQGP